MNRPLKITLVLLLVLLGAGAYYYYVNTFTPKHFVSNFLEQLEYNGVGQVDSDFFISEIYATPHVSWDKYLASKAASSSSLSKEQQFQRWKAVYLSGIDGYDDVSIDFPRSVILTNEQFRETYKGFEFISIQPKQIEVSDNYVRAVGYTRLKHSNELIQLRFAGEQKWKMSCRKGPAGWKVISFALQL